MSVRSVASGAAVAFARAVVPGSAPAVLLLEDVGGDPAVTATVVARLLPDTVLLVPLHPERQLLYNAARTAATLHRLLRDRVAFVVEDDAFSDGLRSLWRSWPAETLVLDKATGVFADLGPAVEDDAAAVGGAAGTSSGSGGGALTVPLAAHDRPSLLTRAEADARYGPGAGEGAHG
jgi:hypothetical protein